MAPPRNRKGNTPQNPPPADAHPPPAQISNAQRPPKAQPARNTTVNTVRACMTALQFLVLAAVSSPISQLSLSPVYGAIPASINHPNLLVGVVLLAWTAKSGLEHYLPSSITYLLPAIAFAVPLMQTSLFQYSGQLGPFWGPIVTEALTYLPLAVLSVYSAAKALDKLDLSGCPDRMRSSGPAIISYFIFTATQRLSAPWFARNMGSSLIMTRTGLQFLIGVCYSLLLPSRMLVLAVLPILHFATMNVHVPLERTTAVLNSTLHSYDFSLVARQESLTGYISVLDNRKDGYRVMRCDHSLLGGEWFMMPEYKGKVNDPVYSIFVMLEAVRLIETASKKKPSISDSQASALVMYVHASFFPPRF